MREQNVKTVMLMGCFMLLVYVAFWLTVVSIAAFVLLKFAGLV